MPRDTAAEIAPPLKVLWLTRECPLRPDRGDLIYSDGMLRALLAAGVEAVMLCHAQAGRAYPLVAGLEVRALAPPRRARWPSLFTRLPSDAFRNQSAAFAAAVTRALDEGVGAVVIDYYAMGWTLPLIQAHRVMRGPAPPVLIYLSHQDEQTLRPKVARSAPGPLRAVLSLDAAKAARMDRALVSAADVVTAITEQDRQAFQARAPGKTVIALTPGHDCADPSLPPFDDLRPRRVLLLGGFAWIAKRHNLIGFLEAADPLFRAAGIELEVVGHAGPRFIRAVSDRFRSVRFAGSVKDIGPHVAQARIGLMPDVLGAGFKLKYLDYIFHGLPVATIRSQAVGLPLDVDRDMIAAETPRALAKAIVAAIDDLALLQAMRERAFAACRGAFDWGERGRALHAAIDAARSSSKAWAE